MLSLSTPGAALPRRIHFESEALDQDDARGLRTHNSGMQLSVFGHHVRDARRADSGASSVRSLRGMGDWVPRIDTARATQQDSIPLKGSASAAAPGVERVFTMSHSMAYNAN